MAGEAQDAVWPLPKFYFKVTLGSQDNTTSFQEVSGLDTETQPIEYRHGDNKLFSTIKFIITLPAVSIENQVKKMLTNENVEGRSIMKTKT